MVMHLLDATEENMDDEGPLSPFTMLRTLLRANPDIEDDALLHVVAKDILDSDDAEEKLMVLLRWALASIRGTTRRAGEREARLVPSPIPDGPTLTPEQISKLPKGMTVARAAQIQRERNERETRRWALEFSLALSDQMVPLGRRQVRWGEMSLDQVLSRREALEDQVEAIGNSIETCNSVIRVLTEFKVPTLDAFVAQSR